MITRKIIFSILLAGGIVLQAGQVAYADVTIDGQVYTDAWIAAHPTEVANYIKSNPTTAAAVAAAASASTQEAILSAYNQVTGSSMTLDAGRVWATTNAQGAPVVIVNGQAYTDAWIKSHQTEVAAYIQANPSQAVSVLRDASASTVQSVITNDWVKKNKDTVLTFIQSSPNQAASILKNVDTATVQTIISAYNAKNPNAPITQAQANDWLKQNASESSAISADWLAKNPGYKGYLDWKSKVNEGQLKLWLSQNPNLTPKQIVDAMVMYDININMLANASGKDAQDLIKIAGQAGLTKEVLAQKGLIGEMNGADTRNNVWWAVMVGALPKGVFYALQKIDQGASYNNPEASYSQADMDLAIKLQRNGYWGPTGTGDVSIELAKAGCMNGLVYNEKKCGNGWLGAGAGSTGQNIYRPGTGVSTSSAASVILTADKSIVVAGSPVILTWSSNAVSGCTMNEQADWFCPGSGSCATVMPQPVVTQVSVAGFSTKNPTATTTYSLTCTSSNGVSVSKSVRVLVGSTSTTCYDCGGNAAPTPVIDSESCLNIPMTLSYQSRDSSTSGFVTLLQDFLHATNYLPSLSTGFFGAGTFKAVKDFQRANGISQTGSVGPNTRLKIKQISCSMPVAELTDSQVTIPDSAVTSSLPTGCTTTTGYSPVTGVKCSSSLPEGCTAATNFSPITGAKCVAQ